MLNTPDNKRWPGGEALVALIFAVIAAPIGHPVYELLFRPLLARCGLLVHGRLNGWSMTIVVLFCLILATNLVAHHFPIWLLGLWKRFWADWFRRFWLCVLVGPLLLLLAGWGAYHFSLLGSLLTQPAEPALFTLDDITSLPSFNSELAKPTALSECLRSHLRKSTLAGLALATNSPPSSLAPIKQELVADLNRFISHPAYLPQLCSGAARLPPKVTALLRPAQSTASNSRGNANDGDSRARLWAQRLLVEEQFARVGALRCHYPLNDFYRLLSTMLIYIMQFGFIAFEAGSVRKNFRLESAAKNLLVFITAFGTYVGLSLLDGDWLEGLTGNCLLAHKTDLETIYHAGFASTASLIIANTITERTTVLVNLLLAAVTAGLGYPLLSGLLWDDGWLWQRGFIDTAGACVVHLFGGMIGFFSAILAGSSLRTKAWYLLNKPKQTDQRELIPLSAVGGLLLWFGWLGFNSGNAATDQEFLTAFRNTSLAVCGGAAASVVLFFFSYSALSIYYSRANHRAETFPSKLRVLIIDEFVEFYAAVAEWERVILGMMGGLVCVTANASRLSAVQAFKESFIGGMVVVLGSSFVAVKMRRRLDDPTGAVATHALAGLTGVCLLTRYYLQDGADFGVQLFGCGVCVVLAWSLAVAVRLLIWALVALTESVAIGTLNWWWAGLFLQLYRLRLSFVHQVTGKCGIELLAPSPHTCGDESAFLKFWDAERWRDEDATVRRVKAANQCRASTTAAARSAARLGEYLLQEEPESSGLMYQHAAEIVHRTGALQNIIALGAPRDWVELRRTRFALMALVLLNEHNEFISGCADFGIKDILRFDRYISLLSEGAGLQKAGTLWQLLHQHWVEVLKRPLPELKQSENPQLQQQLVEALNACKNGPQGATFAARLLEELNRRPANMPRDLGLGAVFGKLKRQGPKGEFVLKGADATWGSRYLLGYLYPDVFAKNILDRCNDLADLFLAPPGDVDRPVTSTEPVHSDALERSPEIERQRCLEALILAVAYLAEDLATSRELVEEDEEHLVFAKALFNRSFKSLELLSQRRTKRREETRGFFAPWETRRLAHTAKVNLAASLLASKFGPP